MCDYKEGTTSDHPPTNSFKYAQNTAESRGLEMAIRALRPSPAPASVRVQSRKALHRLGQNQFAGRRRQHEPNARRAAHEPGWHQQHESDQNPQDRPGEQAVMDRREQGGEHGRLHQEGLGQLPQREHEGAYPRVILDLRTKGPASVREAALPPTKRARTHLEAQVRMGVHLGEKEGVGALIQQPALALQTRGHRLVRLVEQAELVQTGDACDDHATEGGERDHELPQHLPRSYTPTAGAAGGPI